MLFLFSFFLLRFIFYRAFVLRVSLLTTSPSASFFLHADLHEPSCHRPIVVNPHSAADPRWPISVSFLCFMRLCLCFSVDLGLSFGLCLCFRLGFCFGYEF